MYELTRFTLISKGPCSPFLLTVYSENISHEIKFRDSKWTYVIFLPFSFSIDIDTT